MSEYQYYEFRTINRHLTPAERAAVNKLSSHGHTTATSFSVDYSYGDFKHNPDEVLARYFDAFFYTANWGTITLKFRYPKGALNLYGLAPYCLDGAMIIDTKTVSDSVIVSFDWNPEEGSDWVEAEGMLDGVVGIYHEIMSGDYRAFYLAWLKAIQGGIDYSEEFEEDTLEPPVPAGLDTLSPALIDFMAMFEIDKDLVAAAAQASRPAPSSPDPTAALATLTKEECIDFLRSFLEGEPQLEFVLKQRLGLLPPPTYAPTGERTIAELWAARKTAAQQRRQAAAAAKAVQQQADLAALAKRGENAWRDVEKLIERRTGDAYDQAAYLLQQLGELARQQGQTTPFTRRLEQIRTQYSRRSALLRALKQVGLL